MLWCGLVMWLCAVVWFGDVVLCCGVVMCGVVWFGDVVLCCGVVW